MKNLIISILMLIPLSTFAQLTGYWQTDVGGCYQIRQDGNEVWWAGESASNKRAIIVFHGILVGNTLNGQWCDMPSHDKQNCGQGLSLRIENDNRMVKTGETISYYGSVWTRSNGPCTQFSCFSYYISALPEENKFLNKNECIVSPSGKCFLYMQEDGNLVLYKGSGPNDRKEVIWHSATHTEKVTDSFVAIQNDGNLVVYRGLPGQYQDPVWDSKTFREKGSYCIAVKDEGRIVIYKGISPSNNSDIIWSKP